MHTDGQLVGNLFKMGMLYDTCDKQTVVIHKLACSAQQRRSMCLLHRLLSLFTAASRTRSHAPAAQSMARSHCSQFPSHSVLLRHHLACPVLLAAGVGTAV